jgi:hypothetical protein
MNRIAIAAMLAALVVTTGACAGAPTATEEGTSEEALTLTPAQRADRIITMLSEPGGLMMPPRGVEFGANELTATAELVPYTGGSLAELLEERAKPILPDLDADPAEGILGLSKISGNHVTLQFGSGEAEIQSYLLNSLVALAKRRYVAAHLEHLSGASARFSVYNTDSSGIGQDIIVLHPYDLQDQVIVVTVTYINQ